MASHVKPIPDGYHSITPYLVVQSAAQAIDFYKRVFRAEELVRMDGPEGKIGHAELKIGDSCVMLSDEMMGNRSPRSFGGSPVGLFLYVEDVDAVFDSAVRAGATSVMPPADMFWGDRYGKLTDPFGHNWSVATHVEDVTPEQMDERAQKAAQQMAQAATP